MSHRFLPAATLFVAQLIVVGSAPADQPRLQSNGGEVDPEESRQHYVLRHPKDKTVHYEVTVVDRSSERLDETWLLVSDVGLGRSILHTRHFYEDQSVVYEMSDVTRKDYIRTSFTMPYTAKTRSGMLREARNSPTVGMLPALLTITTPGGEWRSVDFEAAEWQRLRELRASIRPTVSFSLIESAERMRGSLFAISAGRIFYDFVAKYLVYQTSDDTSFALEQVYADPSCDFDRSFGFPCSDEQQTRVKAAAKAGSELTHY
ncbi:MAG TPA: hypothetical protein VGF28_09170 [Thermoanaerobaculia bacterium]|jgi:hypothetical protein